LLLVYRTNRTDLAINGIFGAGKTRTMALLLAFLSLQPGTQVVVVAKESVATRALSQYLQEFLQQSLGSEAVKLVGRYCSAEEYQRVGTGRTPFDVHPDDRRAFMYQSRVVLVTAGVLKGQLGTYRSHLSLFPQAALVVHEEAQQFGALTEAIAMTTVASCALRVWSGDRLQTPGGLERTDEAKATRAKVVGRCQGIRVRTASLVPDALAVRGYALCDAPLS
jgi:hypothetical protein